MWLIGSLLSQIAILVIAPQDYRNGWFFYIFMTLAYSLVGVFTFGFASLLILHSFPRIFSGLATWQVGIPTGIFCGWLATALLIVIALIVIGEADKLAQSLQWLLAAFFGSLYGAVGASYMHLTNDKK
ncbi:MAG: hypothetical protein RL693_726 [Verrucomicrobiota bacterium]|jgi:hypothetical protein